MLAALTKNQGTLSWSVLDCDADIKPSGADFKRLSCTYLPYFHLPATPHPATSIVDVYVVPGPAGPGARYAGGVVCDWRCAHTDDEWDAKYHRHWKEDMLSRPIRKDAAKGVPFLLLISVVLSGYTF